jgi:sugar lactone lactonase YvrE
MTGGRFLLLGAALLAAPACDRANADSSDLARHVMRLEGFDFPESVRYDPQQDVFFISNILGYGSVKDGQGYIARVDAGDLRQPDFFIRSGVGGAVLDAPKGMAIQGDTLWVADIDQVRGFDRRTGKPVGDIDMRPYDIVMLNDLALGPDGALYVTDSGIVMSRVGVAYYKGSKILKIEPGRKVSVFAKSEALAHPNGITWDSAGKQFVVVTFHPSQSELYSLGANNQKNVMITGLGRFDGVESLHDGRIVLTSWADSSVQMVQDGKTHRIINDVWQPADLGLDTRRNRLAIPLVLQGRVEIYQLPN